MKINIRQTIFVAGILCLFLFAFSSCKKSYPLEGTWVSEEGDVLEFKKGGQRQPGDTSLLAPLKCNFTIQFEEGAEEHEMVGEIENYKILLYNEDCGQELFQLKLEYDKSGYLTGEMEYCFYDGAPTDDDDCETTPKKFTNKDLLDKSKK